MEEKLSAIKKWLGTGSINIFGFPMSGKDTQGVKLAEAIGGRLLSSGIIIRAKELELHKNLTSNGDLIPTDIFYEWVLPYFSREDLKSSPLILSSIGRWDGEENTVMEAAKKAGHEIKAVVLLNISEADVQARFQKLQILNDRGERQDDKDLHVFLNRLEEFRTKTMPVLEHYKALGLLVNVNGDQSREEVFAELVDKLYEFSQY
ncbi:MAG: nucleoside monophosphate kinase [Candidatus Saccharibacteria bacterium]|nr:nucleoside monophosphate kinase [Candidatus Saccharibacteria bacterium]